MSHIEPWAGRAVDINKIMQALTHGEGQADFIDRLEENCKSIDKATWSNALSDITPDAALKTVAGTVRRAAEETFRVEEATDPWRAIRDEKLRLLKQRRDTRAGLATCDSDRALEQTKAELERVSKRLGQLRKNQKHNRTKHGWRNYGRPGASETLARCAA